MESEAVLRKLLLVAFLSVVSTGTPACAVDYLNCREMLRTKNEFARKLSTSNIEYFDGCSPYMPSPEKMDNIISRDKQIIKLKSLIEDAEKKFEREQLIISDNGNMVLNENISTDDIIRMSDNLFKTTDRLKKEIFNRTILLVPVIVGLYYNNCLSAKTNKGNFNKEEQKSSYKRTGYSFYDDNGYYWYKKVLRVKEDMRKANCPY